MPQRWRQKQLQCFIGRKVRGHGSVRMAVDIPHTCCISFPGDQPMPGPGSAPESYFTGYWDTLYLRMPILGTQAPSHQPFYKDLPYSHLTLSLGPWVLGLVIAKEVTHWYVSAEKWGDGL